MFAEEQEGVCIRARERRESGGECERAPASDRKRERERGREATRENRRDEERQTWWEGSRQGGR